jgi:hypothetical protein
MLCFSERHNKRSADPMQLLFIGEKIFLAAAGVVGKNFIGYSSSHLIVCKATKRAACALLLTHINSFPHSFSPNC